MLGRGFVLLLLATKVTLAVASLSNWHIGQFYEDCDTVCVGRGACQAEGRKMLDSAQKMNWFLSSLGGAAPTCTVNDPGADKGIHVPSFWQGNCFYYNSGNNAACDRGWSEERQMCCCASSSSECAVMEPTTTTTTTTTLDPALEVAGYSRYPGSCVGGYNIAIFSGKTLGQCATLCEVSDPTCLAFEFGVDYGGLLYKEGDCITNKASDSTGCSGSSYNLDLYVRQDVYGYTPYPKACVSYHNIVQHTGKLLAECAELCDAVAGSVAFEYGVDHGGSAYSPGDCVCQDSTDTAGCDGAAVNLDLYVKDRVDGYTRQAEACVSGHNIAAFTGKTLPECAGLCRNQVGSVAFEYGVQYGGSPYEPGDCNCNDSTDSTGCRGRSVNLDLWVMEVSVPGYTRQAESCVRNHNIEKHSGKTLAECAALCSANLGCVAFEYGVAYGGSPYLPQDCVLNDSSNSDGCPGASVNLDLYVLKERRRLKEDVQQVWATLIT